MDLEKYESIARLLSTLLPWKPISQAPTNGSVVIVYASRYGDLPGFVCCAAYTPNEGWCVDELRHTTHFLYFHDLLPLSPKEPR